MVNIDQSLCVGCGLCAGDCLKQNIVLKAGKAVVGDNCLACGHCVAICPAGAVSIPDYDMADWVLSSFKNQDAEDMLAAAARAAQAAQCYITQGADRAMNRFN